MKKIQDYKLVDRVSLLGTHTDVNELYSAFDCFYCLRGLKD